MKKIAVVTGASSGLGREFVRQIAKETALDEIWVIARRRDRLLALEQEVTVPLRILALDLTDPQALDAYSAELRAARPSVELLVHAAGFGKMGDYRTIALEDATRMIDLNCKAAVSITERTLWRMHRGSRILEICSTAAFQPLPALNVYAATKSFLYHYTRALRVELRGRCIGVTAVCPYWIKDTEFIENARRHAGSDAVRHFRFASAEREVVAQALSDSRQNRAVSTPGAVCSMDRIAAKILPSSLLMEAWNWMRTK